jgi:hypothetical protein
VILQREAAEDEENVAAPLGVVGGLEVKNDRNQVLDVLDGGGLAVQMSDGRGFKVDGVVVVVVMRVVVAVGLSTETISKDSSLLLQGVGLRALLLEGSSSGTDTLLGSGGRLEEVGVLLQLLAALGVGGSREAASSSSVLAAARASSRSLAVVAAAKEPELESPEVGAAMGVRGDQGGARGTEEARRPKGQSRAPRGAEAEESKGPGLD